MQPGCLFLAGAFLAGVAVVFVISFLLMRRGDGSVDLGPADGYVANSVVYRASDMLLVVRPADGALVAFSDRDPHNPPGRDSCRVTYRADLGGADPGGDGTSGRFFDNCTRSMYDLTGHGLSGDGLNLQQVRVEQDEEGRLRAFPKG